MALHINYAEYKAYPLSCPSCGWSGLGKETCQNAGGMVMDLECPNCYRMLAVINFPSFQETLSRGSEAERQAVLKEINFRERFKRMSLKSPDEPIAASRSLSITLPLCSPPN